MRIFCKYASVVPLPLGLQNLPGDGVDLILVLVPAGLEVDLILAALRPVVVVVVVQLHLAVPHGVRREAGVAG